MTPKQARVNLSSNWMLTRPGPNLSTWYVSQLPGDGGKDWGYTTKADQAIAASTYWMRRFKADMSRVGTTANVRALTSVQKNPKPSNTVFLGYMQKGGKVSDFNGKEIGTYRVTSSRKTPNSHISDTQYILRVNLPGKGEFVGWSAGNNMAITGRQAVKKNPKRANQRKRILSRGTKMYASKFKQWGAKAGKKRFSKVEERQLIALTRIRSKRRGTGKRLLAVNQLKAGSAVFNVNRIHKGKKYFVAAFVMKKDAFQYARALHLAGPQLTITVTTS